MTPIEKSGHYFLVNHGNQLHIINEVQYLKTRTENFISNSTQWMFFYGISMMIYFLNWKKNCVIGVFKNILISNFKLIN